MSQPTRMSAAIEVLAICCARKATRSSKSRVCRAPARAHGSASTRTPQSAQHPAQAVEQVAALAAEVEVAPAALGAVAHPREGLAAARAGRSPPREPQLDEDAVGAERDVGDRRAGQAQQAVECGGDAHVVLLGAADLWKDQQPAGGGRVASLSPGQLPRGRYEGRFPALSRNYGRQFGARVPLEWGETRFGPWLTGGTSAGRKGTARAVIQALLEQADHDCPPSTRR